MILFNTLKKKKHYKDFVIYNESNPSQEFVSQPDLIVKELEEIVNNAIEKLPPKRKEIYLLSRQEGLSYKEIAERLQISPKTVENQKSDALKFIREYLKGLGLFSIVLLFILLFLIKITH